MKNTAPLSAPDLDFETPAAKRLRRYRRFKDRLASAVVGVGGISVIVAIMLIFIYLLYEVMPLFHAAEIKPWQHEGEEVVPYQRPGADADTWYLTAEEQAEVGLRVDATGLASFFDTRTGEVGLQQMLGQTEAGAVAFALGSESERTFALAHADGNLTFAKHQYKVSYPNDVRTITPSIAYPYADQELALAPGVGNTELLAVRDSENQLMAAALDDQGQLFVSRYSKDVNFITEEVEISTDHLQLELPTEKVVSLLISPETRWLFVARSDGLVVSVDLRDFDAPQIHDAVRVSDATITQARFLLGGNSLLVADSQGVTRQLFLVRDDSNNYELKEIRSFRDSTPSEIAEVAIEHRRKGFVVAEGNGQVSFYNSTAENLVLNEQLSDSGIAYLAMTPRANGLLLEQADGKVSFWKVENEHPEVSWSSLWEEVWYEGYQEPDYIWQSSASNDDFEPKYSLAPLSFGTLKAAFYAMLLATPLAICGAIYTAYFMAPAMRTKIKPFIELMEALPTVILGFLAGLWLAPFIEKQLATVFTLLLVVPIGVLVFAYGWHNLPKSIRLRVSEGWDVVVIIPVVIILAWLCLPLSSGVEQVLFDGDMRGYITRDLGITFDQRNALVVGLAMGFAVIPTIFSITEDAIFSVPKSLSNGSLALGATPWQTLQRVVLPTASPGIFSAVMIGMGRAVGETMIVLMATGNTPIMDLNIFEGMRTLAANIAVEMPESEVGSSHFRILFLAALVLFAFTFVVNTLAELIRQRLRRKYGSL
ncbi:ABC transporter permease subunit [Motiliproteus coralliicola]|uniref:ABC transporter permease subunit n=1 Tax=Motiliproteus coralliicola TaxID=2283196 RepID=A0A369WB17_9GAMM|nr:ABC transporter permease subunit [Motiliproteus coralliicola]RDE18359.1 ABC transporter permease subunit [Motiliproteus coralliicola]